MHSKTYLFLLLFIFFAACSPPDYGTRLAFGKAELYYTEHITESEAIRLQQYLQGSGTVDQQPLSVQIDKQEGTYQFKMVMVEGAEADEENIQAARVTTGELSEFVFHGAPVDFHFCDERLRTRMIIPYAGSLPKDDIVTE
ncbi:MAG TPA: hypothetical protein DHW15_05695 [Bacteroidetes bacterium]|jgi:hypothetical protein|nr:MAG: hypothetical protein ABR94_02545 [Sphingobacteriales bacterium BACL12 MAG-120802-bin5]KRP12041.1 MAG: hypothetical protein ABR95_05670 [Sphingobacteriales bacterium BACL12 MAG-120813-bin55]HCK21653.1 hypothetical protein [Bacteroidota bacterium]